MKRFYELKTADGLPWHHFAVSGEHGGVHIDAQDMRPVAAINRDWLVSLHVHSRSGEGEPNHKDCWIIGGPCWVGTSYLSGDMFVDLLNDSGEANDALYDALEKEYQERFVEARP